jgi:hypothetical protein
MDLDDETRNKLELLILDPLCKKDAEAALERFKGQLGEKSGMYAFFLSNALKDWAKRDVSGATAWLDREIGTGTLDAKSLDGENAVRTRFESAVVFGWFAADPAKAEARLSKLPPSLRADILAQADSFHKMGAQDEIAFAEIVRRQLDEEGRVEAISKRAGKVIGKGGDLAAVDNYLDSVYAAPDEREKSAVTVARQYNESFARKGEMSAEKLEAMRSWVGRDAPGSVDRLTGEALAKALAGGGGMDFAEASKHALEYRETSGTEEPLIHFLSGIPQGPYKAEAMDLLEKISDPAERRALRHRFDPP